MNRVSRKIRLVVLITAVAYSVASLILRVRLEGSGFDYEPVPPEVLATLTVVFIPLTIFCLSLPWLIQFGRAPWLTQTRRGKAVPPAFVLLFCYVFLLSPLVFGGMLYACGMPITQAIYFYAAAIIATLTWGIYDLRKV